MDRAVAGTTFILRFVVLLVAMAPATAQGPTRSSPALSPMLVDTFAPLLAMLISSERDAAKALGVEPIPDEMRAALAGYVPEETLDRVRWREGGTQLSLPQNVIRFGHVPAMTLDDVVVFQDRRAALEDSKLWAHELKHVMQFAEWGVGGFAVRYLQNYDAVEEDAWEFRWQYMKRAGLTPPVPGVQ